MYKDKTSLENLRHSCAHLLAKAVIDLWPNTKNAIGPSTENGFYQDFDLGDIKVSESDFPKIEEKMHEILQTWKHFEFKEITIEEARELFKNNLYKIELAEEFAARGEKLTINNPGNFIDLCKMDHVENPSKELRFFKLLSVAGAYWRGKKENQTLTRIYGTCWPSKEELVKHLAMLEESKKRDHKKLGVELDLFTFSELVGSGLPLFTPKGTIIRDLLDNFVWELRQKYGYQKVDIPHITKRDLYEKSGHWDKFENELFKITTREGHLFAIKPMNCPHHAQIYARKSHSYRELPQRYTSTTKVYRDEQSGELAGLSRVRSITQDDAHVFCRISQIKDEVKKIWDMVHVFYEAFGMNLELHLSLRDSNTPEKYLGNKEHWDKAEKILREISKENNTPYIEALGDAAFYAPKLDFIATDSLGREWQVATIQLDVYMPESFDLYCINERGEKERIVMIHAAIMGSIERFLSVLIEHYTGAFPVWLSPIQVIILPISDRQNNWTNKIYQELTDNSIRTEINADSETLGKKIRKAEIQKIPYILIIGEKEKKDKTIAIRQGGKAISSTGEDQVKLETFIQKIKREIEIKNP